MRELRYQAIAEDLRRRLTGGEFPPGRLLPSEAALSTTYGASRITVRRALDDLRTDGLVESRQGLGWLAAPGPLRQSLGRLGTIEAQLAAAGMVAERRVLDFGFVSSSRQVAAALGVGTVLRVRRLNLADGVPFGRVTVWVPDDLAASLSRADAERSPFYELLPVRLAGATQTIGATAASKADAALLEVRPGSPVLRCERLTHDVSGRPVLFSEQVFPGHGTEFVVELPSAWPSMAATGLHLLAAAGGL